MMRRIIAALLLSFILLLLPVASQLDPGNVGTISAAPRSADAFRTIETPGIVTIPGTLATPGPQDAQGLANICERAFFSTEEDFITRGPKPADGNPIVSDGDLLGPGCIVFARNRELLSPFKVEEDLGLDAVDVIDVERGLIVFSTELNDPEGKFTAGDLLSTNGAIVPNFVLLARFGIQRTDLGLDAIHFIGSSDGIAKFLDHASTMGRERWLQSPDMLPEMLENYKIDIWFSTEGTASTFQNFQLLDGDLLSARDGVIVAQNSLLLPASVPAGIPDRGVDFGLDAVVADRTGNGEQIHFSTEILYRGWPSFTDGDVLLFGNGPVCTNNDLVLCFEPATKELGLDALSIAISEEPEPQICYPNLPPPQLVLTGTEDYVAGGREFVRYRLLVNNWNFYPQELFEPAPDLPPCGANTEASRTWVDIYDQDGSRIYGFYALSSPEGLKNLWFAVEQGRSPPKGVYITLTDRRCDIVYRSNLVSTGIPGTSETPGLSERPSAPETPGLETPGLSRRPGASEAPSLSERPSAPETPGIFEVPGISRIPGLSGIAVSELVDIYFADARESPGSVYHYTGRSPSTLSSEEILYTRPSRNLYSFTFHPGVAEKLYYVNANENKIYITQETGSGWTFEDAIYSHNTYVRDIAFAFDEDGDLGLYFSEASGSRADGNIYKVEGDKAHPYYEVKLSLVDGYWSGDFAFDNEGNLYLSSGNTVPARIYRVEDGTGSVEEIFRDDEEPIKGLVYRDGRLYYANWRTKIYRLDLNTNTRAVVYSNPDREWTSDVCFRGILTDPGLQPKAGDYSSRTLLFITPGTFSRVRGIATPVK